MNGDLLIVSSSPHIRAGLDYPRAVRYVIMALVPALAWGVYCFGGRAAVVCLVSVAACLAGEAAWLALRRRSIDLRDGSAFLTGLLLGMNLPASVPVWLPAVGGVFAVIVVKQIFGGLGYNILNPALAGRAFLTVSWPALMTAGWLRPLAGFLSGLDGISAATPLAVLKDPGWFGPAEAIIHRLNDWTTIGHFFFGRTGGSIGETSSLLLIIGGVFLLILGIVDHRIVSGYLAAFTLGAWLFFPFLNPLLHLSSGGLMLGVFFMATDWVTSPVSKRGRWIFGAGCGILTIALRKWGSYPEGVAFAILIMNILTPLIDRLTRERIFGDRMKKELA